MMFGGFHKSDFRMVPRITDCHVPSSGKRLELVVHFRNAGTNRVGYTNMDMFDSPFVVPSGKRSENTFIDRICRKSQLPYRTEVFYDIRYKCKGIERVLGPQ